MVINNKFNSLHLKGLPVIKILSSAALISVALFGSSAHANNGLLIEGYGAASLSLGGAGVAMDLGAAGMVNNPATLAMMSNRRSRLDVGASVLMPSHTTSHSTVDSYDTAESQGVAYFLPDIGYVRRDGLTVYGAGIYGQANLVSEYDANSWLGKYTGRGAHTEISVNSLTFPLAYKVSDQLMIGASADVLWGQADLVFGMPLKKLSVDGEALAAAGTFADLTNTMDGNNIMGSASGSLVNNVADASYSMLDEEQSHTAAVIDLSDGSDFTGRASAFGVGGKIGLAYKAKPDLTIGMTYRMQSYLGDMKGKGLFRLIDSSTGLVAGGVDVAGEYSIQNLQLPAVLTAGVSYQLNRSTWLMADYSHIGWSSVMDNVNISFSGENNVAGYENTGINISLRQEWENQHVVKLGLAKQLSRKLTLQAGLSLANNPVPDDYVTPILPGIAQTHMSGGFTYSFNRYNRLTMGASYSPEVSQTNRLTQDTVTASQMNVQLGYTYDF